MIKRKFSFGFLAAFVISVASVVSSVQPVSAANPSLTNNDTMNDIHFSGSAYWGGSTPPVMSKAESTSIKPYNYGAYVLMWNFNNPNRNTIESVTITTFICANPTQCSTEASKTTVPIVNKRPTSDTYRTVIDRADFHKKWIRTRLQIVFSDGFPTMTNWSNSRFYINDTARNEIPKPSSLSADNSSVPANTAMTMAFNQWSGLTEWDAGAQLRFRSMRILRCTSRPAEDGSTFVSNNSTPDGCTRIAINPVFDPHDNQAKTLSFTSGAAGTFIYALDTLAFSNMPNAGDIVYLQKRSIYSTIASAQNGGNANPAAGAGAAVGADPASSASGTTAASPSALEEAGINTTTASVISANGQVSINGITLTLKSKTRYKRSKVRYNIALTATPQTSSAGKVAVALTQKKNGVDVVRKKTSKAVSNGKASWSWNFSTKLPAGRYRLYVTFTPTDPTQSPVTLTRVIRLL